MSFKFSFHVFLCLIFFEYIISYEIIPKYGKKTTYQNNIFLDISGFESGEKIYISFTTNNDYYCSTERLYYNFYDDIDDISIFNYKYSDYETSTSYTQILGYYECTYNYEIKKKVGTAKYLYMEYNFNTPVTIENYEDASKVVIIIIIVIAVVIVAVFAVVFVCCCCRRCRKTSASTVTTLPRTVPVHTYGVQPVVQPVIQPIVQPVVQPVVQPAVQPVDTVQPYGNNYPSDQNYNYDPNNQYNQAAPIPSGSDYRMGQPQTYEKPM